MAEEKPSKLKPKEKQLTLTQGAELERRRRQQIFDGCVRAGQQKRFWGKFKG